MDSITLLLVAVSGLCPLSFLIGLFCFYIVMRQAGHFTDTEIQMIDNVHPKQFNDIVHPLIRGGWSVCTILQHPEQVGIIKVVLVRKRNRIL